MKTSFWTGGYAAPEALSDNEAWKGAYEAEVDVWSLGCVLYRMLVGKHLFTSNQKTKSEVKNTIAKGFKSNSCGLPKDAIRFLRGLICINTTDRYSIEKALKDKWLKSDDLKEAGCWGVMRSRRRPL